MTQLAPLWRASMQFAREQQRIASPSSIVNPSYLRTYAPDCPIESYRSQVDRIAEPFLRLIVVKIRVLPRRRTFSFDPCAFYAREKIADDVSSNSFAAVDGWKKDWPRIIARNYLSKYILPEEPFPIQIRSNGNRIYRSYPSLRSRFFAELEDRRAAVTPFKNVYTSGAHRCGSETEIDRGRSVRLVSSCSQQLQVRSNSRGFYHRHRFLRIYECRGTYRSRTGSQREIGSLLSDRICRLQSEKLFPDRILRERAERTIESNGQSVGAQCATILLLNWLTRSSFQS